MDFVYVSQQIYPFVRYTLSFVAQVTAKSSVPNRTRIALHMFSMYMVDQSTCVMLSTAQVLALVPPLFIDRVRAALNCYDGSIRKSVVGGMVIRTNDPEPDTFAVMMDPVSRSYLLIVQKCQVDGYIIRAFYKLSDVNCGPYTLKFIWSFWPNGQFRRAFLAQTYKMYTGKQLTRLVFTNLDLLKFVSRWRKRRAFVRRLLLGRYGLSAPLFATVSSFWLGPTLVHLGQENLSRTK